MATILRLASLIGERCGRSKEVATFVLRGRETGYLPDSGRGGRGSVASPAATTEQAVLLLLAMARRDLNPKEALAEIAAIIQTPFTGVFCATFDGRQSQTQRVAFDLAALPTAFQPISSLGRFLGMVIEDKRRGVGASVRSLKLDREAETFSAIVSCDAPDGTIWMFSYGHFDSNDPAAIRARVHAMPLVASFMIGGRLLDDIAALLGPITMTGGGGPLAGVADDEDGLAALLRDLPLAALGAVAPEMRAI
jgi:hypothetical protein